MTLLSHCEILPENKEKIEKSKNDDDDDRSTDRQEMTDGAIDRQYINNRWTERKEIN